MLGRTVFSVQVCGQQQEFQRRHEVDRRRGGAGVRQEIQSGENAEDRHQQVTRAEGDTVHYASTLLLLIIDIGLVRLLALKWEVL